MRNVSRIILFVLLILLYPPLFSAAASGGNANAADPFVRAAADGLSAVALLPDASIPLERILVAASSAMGTELGFVTVDSIDVEREISRLERGARSAIRDRKDPREVVSALNRYLFVEEGFAYDPAAGDPENYLLDRVLARRRGNCLGFCALYLILADRLSLPLHVVYVPSHCFVRYDDGRVRINIESGDRGAERGDGRYVREFALGEGRPYLQSLGRKEMVGIYLKCLGAAFSRRGMEERAIRLYGEAAAFYPGLPDTHFNAGVSFHKMGRLDDAVAQYRRALSLDPGLAVAQDNLGVALAKKGHYAEALVEARRAVALRPANPVTRGNLAATLCACGMVEDGIREYRKVLEIEPDNVRALAGLANAHYARGEYREAIVHCDKARRRGCEFDPVMLGTLEKHRDPSPSSLP